MNTVPELPQANGSVRNWQRNGDITQFDFSGYYQPFFELSNASQCRVSIDGQPASGETISSEDSAPRLHFSIPAHDQKHVEINCGA